MADNKTFTPEETIGLIRAKAQDTQHGDSFQVKVYRRHGVAGFARPSETLATLAGATVEHISNPEQWLQKLVGGGNLYLKIYSDAEPGKQIGGDIHITIQGDVKAIDPNVMKSGQWRGPPELKYPDFGATQPQVPQPWMTIGANPAQTTMYPPPQAPAATPALPLGPTAAEIELKNQLAQAQAALQQMQAAIASRDVALAEERAARERERMQREHDAKMASLEAKIDRLATAAPIKSPTESIAALGATFMPLVQTLIATSNETKLQMMRLQETSQQQLQAFMLKSMERPAISPEVQSLLQQFQNQIEKLKETDPAQHNIISQMADAFGGMSQMMMGVLEQAVNSGVLGGKQESTGLMIVRELAKAVEAFGRAGANAVGGKRMRLAPPKLPAPAAPAAAVATGPQAPIAQPAPQANGFAGAPPNPLDEVEERIRAEEDPAAVATAFVAALQSTVVQAEIAQAGGIVELFGERLGDWADEHVEYARELLAEVQKQAIAAGVLQPAEEDGTVEAE